MSRLFTSGGQSIGASASVLPVNIQDWFPLGWTGWTSLQSKGLSSSSPTPQFKSISSSALVVLMVQLSHPYMTTGKTIALTLWTFVGKVMSLLFNMLSRLVIAFLPRSKRLRTSWLQSLSTVIMEPQKIKSVTASTFSPSIYREVMEPDAMIWGFGMLSFKPAFSPSSFTLIKKLFYSSSQWCHCMDHLRYHLQCITYVSLLCISEVVDISPSNLHSSLRFIQSSISHNVLCIEVK